MTIDPDRTTRRDFLKRLGAAAAALGTAASTPREAAAVGSAAAKQQAAVASAASGEANARPARPRNVVLIMADDLGRECLGSYGGTSYATPQLDAMARAGVQFDQCYAGPLCTPSRVQIMTGRYNFRNYQFFGILPRGETTFGDVMKAAGCATAAVGKWQLWGGGKGSLPRDAGFDEHCLWQVKDRGSRYARPSMSRNGTLEADLEGRYGPDVASDFALDFIDRHAKKPFFLYYPMSLTHAPFEPTPDSPEWTGRSGRNDDRFFGPMVEYMDKLVGRLLRHLDERGLAEDTLVLFTSDNGTPRSIESRMGDRVVRGGKGMTTDSGTHVPLIARWTGAAPAGRRCGDLVDLSDFLPTVAAAGGAALPSETLIDGHSFLPQIRGEAGSPRDWIYCWFEPKMLRTRYAKRVYVRDPRFKLYGSGALYDALADPEELDVIEPGRIPAADASRVQLQQVIDRMREQGA